MNFDEYGNGRQSVIKEMIFHCEVAIEKLKEKKDEEETHAWIGGKIKGYQKVIQKLKAKESNLKELP